MQADLAAGRKVFEEAIEAYLTKNGHRVTVMMEPDTSLEEKQQKQEVDKLAQIKAGMSDEDLEKVIEVRRPRLIGLPARLVMQQPHPD